MTDYQPQSQAGRELERIKKLSAFTIQGYHEKRRLNQHAVQYRFRDASFLWIYSTTSRGWAYKVAVESLQENLQINR